MSNEQGNEMVIAVTNLSPLAAAGYDKIFAVMAFLFHLGNEQLAAQNKCNANISYIVVSWNC